MASGSGSTKNHTSSARPSKVARVTEGSVAPTSNAPASRVDTKTPHPLDETRNGTGTCASFVPDCHLPESVRNLGEMRPVAQTWSYSSPSPATKPPAHA